MQLTHDSAILKTFSCELDTAAAQRLRAAGVGDEPFNGHQLEAAGLAATLEATQPQGYRQRCPAAAARLDRDRLCVSFRYPMVDEGRYDPPHGVARPKLWRMGTYQLHLNVAAGDTVVASEALTVDPHDLFPRNDKDIMAIDAATQCIECAPRQALYTGEDQVEILLAIRRHRISQAVVEIDVTAREGERPLSGPWRLPLTDQRTPHRFSIAGWADGEYWVRLRLLDGEQPIGAYCVRKFWVQRPLPSQRPAVLELNGQPEVLVDGYSFDQVDAVSFLPAALERPARPMLESTEAHENDGLYVDAIRWDAERKRYECAYRNAIESYESQDTAAERAELKMLAVSDDGIAWHKPSLGRVAFHGSTANNILPADAPILAEPPPLADPQAAEDRFAELLPAATFRFYDSERDGPVDLADVFLSGYRSSFPQQAPSLQEAGDGTDRFRPQTGEYWPFCKRGDEYLVLAREPLLYMGIGMDLLHTTETIRCSVEVVADEQRRLLFYFRPAAPSYPPHDADWDNQPMDLRCLAVLWTADGITYHRRFVISADADDPLGTEFYSMGLLQRAGTRGDLPGRPVIELTYSKINQCMRRRNLYLGSTLLHWGVEQTQAPELIWSRDLLTFHRFRERRRSLVELGEGGSFDAGMIRERYVYWELDGWWWYYYTGVNTRHNGYGILARHPSLEDAREKVWNQQRAVYFSTWEGHFADGKATRYLPGLARLRPYRLAFAETTAGAGGGRLLTAPLRVQQQHLTINATTEPDGAVTCQVLDADGAALGAPSVFHGDSADAQVADVASRLGAVVQIRFTLERARLYAFLI